VGQFMSRALRTLLGLLLVVGALGLRSIFGFCFQLCQEPPLASSDLSYCWERLTLGQGGRCCSPEDCAVMVSTHCRAHSLETTGANSCDTSETIPQPELQEADTTAQLWGCR